jgi:hypothetical protein
MTPDILIAEDLQDKIVQMIQHWLEHKEQYMLAHKKHKN